MSNTLDPNVKQLNAPGNLDPQNPDDMKKMISLIQEWKKTNLDYKYHVIAQAKPTVRDGKDMTTMFLVSLPYAARVQSEGALEAEFESSLANKPKKVADREETAHPGYRMTIFDPLHYKIILEKMSEKTYRARQQFAKALGVKDWEVRVTEGFDGGYLLYFPNIAWLDSQYAKKMEETVHTIGGEGWFYDVIPMEHVIGVHPATPPTFPKAVHIPDNLFVPNYKRTYFGLGLAKKGEITGDYLYIDWTQTAGCMITGMPNGGKSVVANAILGGLVMSGGKLAIIDTVAKSSDYLWIRPYVWLWGCDGLLSACATATAILNLMLGDGERKKAWLEHGWQNWHTDLSDEDKKKYPFITLLIDEMSQLTALQPVPKYLEKDDPRRVNVEKQNMYAELLLNAITRIIQIGRAFGIRVVIVSQVAKQNTGIPPAIRTQMGAQLIQGSPIRDDVKRTTFADPKSVPDLPQRIISTGMSLGCGECEVVGVGSYVYKAFFNATYNSEGKIVQTHEQYMLDKIKKVRPLPAGAGMDSGHISKKWALDVVNNPVFDDDFTDDDEDEDTTPEEATENPAPVSAQKPAMSGADFLEQAAYEARNRGF